MTEPTVVSLFTGAMGLDLGFEQNGFEVRVAVDKDKYAEATIHANHPEIPVIRDNISNLSGSLILERAGLAAGEVTVLTGASPCEPFSTIGKRMSLADTRASLIDEFIRVILEIQPQYWVFENVPGLMWAAKKHISFYERTSPGYEAESDEKPGSAWEDILTAFKATEYEVEHGILNALDYGTPQKRMRLIVIGSANGKVELPKPTHGAPLSPAVTQGELKTWTNVRDAIYGFTDPYPESMKFPAWGKYLEQVPEGGCWRDLPEELQEMAIGKAYESTGGRTGFLRRLSWNKASPTLVDSPITRAACLCHPELTRPLTVGEYHRLQGFPDTWKVEGLLGTKYRLIGQATPVALSSAVAKTILAHEITRSSLNALLEPVSLT